MTTRTDFSEYADDDRVLFWQEHVSDDAGPGVLLDEALGHAVGLRETIAGICDCGSGIAVTRALMLVAVLNRLRESV